MNSKNIKISIAALFLLSFLASAENKDTKITFDDDNGNKISCLIDTDGQTNCKNSSGENVICANSDNGYICSAN